MKIIAVDFDGTICMDKYPSIGTIQPGAKDTLQFLKERGDYIIIYTCRQGELLLAAINWLLDKGIPFDRVNAGNPANIAKYGAEGQKVYADVYIDDHNLGGFPGWLSVKETLEIQ